MDGGNFWCVQWSVHNLRLITSGYCEKNGPQKNTCFFTADRWYRSSFILLCTKQGIPDLLNGMCGYCVGKHSCNALCDPGQFHPGGEDGHLYGHLQFLHHDTSNTKWIGERPSGEVCV